eukprot:5642240-Amphidinium_carterae.1
MELTSWEMPSLRLDQRKFHQSFRRVVECICIRRKLTIWGVNVSFHRRGLWTTASRAQDVTGQPAGSVTLHLQVKTDGCRAMHNKSLAVGEQQKIPQET